MAHQCNHFFSVMNMSYIVPNISICHSLQTKKDSILLVVVKKKSKGRYQRCSIESNPTRITNEQSTKGAKTHYLSEHKLTLYMR